MNKKVKKIACIIMFIFLLIVAARAYLKLIYFPNNPSLYSRHIQRSDFDPNIDQNKIELLDPPATGCVNICWGKEELVSCKKYSRKYNNCNFNCYGYVYNNCTSSKLGIIWGLLTR